MPTDHNLTFTYFPSHLLVNRYRNSILAVSFRDKDPFGYAQRHATLDSEIETMLFGSLKRPKSRISSFTYLLSRASREQMTRSFANAFVVVALLKQQLSFVLKSQKILRIASGQSGDIHLQPSAF